jgi:hypothetical protein
VRLDRFVSRWTPCSLLERLPSRDERPPLRTAPRRFGSRKARGPATEAIGEMTRAAVGGLSLLALAFMGGCSTGADQGDASVEPVPASAGADGGTVDTESGDQNRPGDKATGTHPSVNEGDSAGAPDGLPGDAGSTPPAVDGGPGPGDTGPAWWTKARRRRMGNARGRRPGFHGSHGRGHSDRDLSYGQRKFRGRLRGLQFREDPHDQRNVHGHERSPDCALQAPSWTTRFEPGHSTLNLFDRSPLKQRDAAQGEMPRAGGRVRDAVCTLLGTRRIRACWSSATLERASPAP